MPEIPEIPEINQGQLEELHQSVNQALNELKQKKQTNI